MFNSMLFGSIAILFTLGGSTSPTPNTDFPLAPDIGTYGSGGTLMTTTGLTEPQLDILLHLYVSQAFEDALQAF